MKFFVLTLSLAVLTGTWASVLRDEPDSKLEKLTQQGREDAESFFKTLLGKVAIIERREEGSGIRELLEDVFLNIRRRLQNLNKELPEDFLEALDVFVGVPALVVEKAYSAPFDLRRHGRYKLEELNKALQSALAGYADPILERVGPYAATVRGVVVAHAQDINHKIDEKLPQQVQALRTQLDPHFKKLQELQADIQPYFDHTQELIRKGVETIHKHLLKPYIGPILQLRQKYRDDFRAWARAPVFSPNP
ncbi:uncharacterized protein LOC118087708 isoform X4 [Zootoca vivipara]|uniref:uncharacterized protein LOC118087708 isoform X4 n=1 Tax=Zootoca vivipara TaxID=8524 RepID=UPI00293BAF9A|nr:uncharacterized protein LOC118087708 isoform X4 [Zootoca vivipara]